MPETQCQPVNQWFIRRLLRHFCLMLKRRITYIIGHRIERLTLRWKNLELCFYSLFYNSHINKNYVLDTLIEPMFWFVDHFTSALGPIFVFLVILCLSIFVIIAYIIGLPYWIEKSLLITSVALIIGNYLLINVIFHYYMALTTSPGYPPQDKLLSDVVSICKKCISPKPPRTHHCSVCDRCILKMDHHCPWLNNCIGHYNHRFFFMFCFYTFLGTIFVMIFGVNIAYEFYFNNETETVTITTILQGPNKTTVNETITETTKKLHTWRDDAIVFETILTIGIFAAIGGLGGWHAKLITRGETCIESHINCKERENQRKDNKIYVNPFDRGPIDNWRHFLGLHRQEITWFNLFFPSSHLPDDDGLRWQFQ